MSKGKIIAAGCCVAILVLMLMIGSTPKTIEQFIDYYNKEIKNTAGTRNLIVSDLTLNNVTYNPYRDAKVKELLGGDMLFAGYDHASSIYVIICFNESVSAEKIFAVIEAAILASGEDYDKVAKSLGILTGTKYHINGGDNKETAFNKKTYSLFWVEDAITFTIDIPK